MLKLTSTRQQEVIKCDEILMQQMKDSKNFPNSFTGMSKLERE